MAPRKRVSVDLSKRLQELPAVALKGGIAAPLALKAAELARLAAGQNPVLGAVGPRELLATLVHRTGLDDESLGATVAAYRLAQVWEIREELGDPSPRTGKWLVRLPGPGQQFS